MSPSSSTTCGTSQQVSVTVANNLILPTNPSTPAQSGWNGDIVAITNTAGLTTDDSQDMFQLAAATELVLLSFEVEESTGNSNTSLPDNPLPVGTTGLLSLSVSPSPDTAAENSSCYGLLFAQANNYFPVATIIGELASEETAAISLPMAAPCDSSSGANAYRFLQAITAYPCSILAQQFTAALSADINANPVTGSCANVNAFFAQTNDFKNVDFAIYSAVCSYAFAYATTWANFQPHFTYTIFTTTTTDNASEEDSTTTTIKLIKPLGTVVFALVNQHTPALADAGYSMTWNPNGGSAVALNLVEGQLVSPSDDDANAVCLQTTFMDQVILTGQASAAKQASQALVGVINGVHVVGSPLALDTPAITDNNDGDDGIPSNDATDSKLSVGAMVGIGVDILFLVALLGTIGYLYLKGNIITLSDIAKAMRSGRSKSQKLLKKAGLDEPDQDIEDYLLQSSISDSDDGLSDDSDEDFIQRAQEYERQEIDNIASAALEGAQLKQENKEEMDQLAVRNNPWIDNEINQSSADQLALKSVNLRSPDANKKLNSIEVNIASNQGHIVSEDKAIGLNAAPQSELNNQFVQEQHEEQQVEDSEEENLDPVVQEMS